MSRQRDWVVRVPASSANLGPAFDAVAVALDRTSRSATATIPRRRRIPAVRAFRQAGGEGPLAVRRLSGRSRARLLGRGRAWRACSPRTRSAVGAPAPPGRAVLRDATELEGHADNAAAVVLRRRRRGRGRARRARPARPRARGRRVDPGARDRDGERAPPPPRPGARSTTRSSTSVAPRCSSPRSRPATVDALRVATEDRLHQDRRLARGPRHARRDRRDARARARAARGSRDRDRRRPRSSTAANARRAWRRRLPTTGRAASCSTSTTKERRIT